jgi:acyclic terpene utilization AtuA family protein
VITGRVADPSLVLAACVHRFEWDDYDLNRLAGATVAGHLIECGTQVTGGISTNWLDVPDAAHIGFPIVEVADDGSCIVTKPRGTGGSVTAMTVKEQLVYEIGDPANYLSPDVAVSFLTLDVTDLGNDRVRVGGATGKPRPDKYKVSATYRDGFRAAGTLTVIGRDATEKGRRCGELVIQRVREAGFELRNSVIECIGNGDATGGVVNLQNKLGAFGETVLRVAVECESRDAAERFTRELMPYITAGPQGTTGYAEGRPRVHPVFRYWPCLIDRNAASPHVEIVVSEKGTKPAAPFTVRASAPSAPTSKSSPAPPEKPTHLYDIACARSGDKGTGANIGAIARSNKSWDFLRTWLTADRVSTFFSPLGIESVERFELPNLQALNFVLRGALRRSLRTDAQGKALGQILLEMPLPEEAKRTMGA